MKHLNISYSDVLMMPTYERLIFIDFLNNDIQKEKDYYEEMKSNTTSN